MSPAARPPAVTGEDEPAEDGDFDLADPASGVVEDEAILTVGPAGAGGAPRLDRWLAEALPALSRARLQGLIAAGRVSLDGATIVEASARVKPGQVACVTVPAAAPARPHAQAIPLAVVYEDADLIVLDKPSGLVVHPAPGSPDGTLVNALLHHCGGSLSGIGGVRRPGIVHRIDKDTSGLLVVAKTDRAHQGLAAQFAAHSVERAYLAVVWGRPRPAAGTVRGPIGRSPANRQKMAVVREGAGKAAVTHYRSLFPLAGDAATLVACRLETGRTHQIRVHMSHIGHPLVGDPLYGGGGRRGVAAAVRARLAAFPRQALHARLLGFDHPVDGRHLRFTSRLPPDLAALLADLGAPPEVEAMAEAAFGA